MNGTLGTGGGGWGFDTPLRLAPHVLVTALNLTEPRTPRPVSIIPVADSLLPLPGGGGGGGGFLVPTLSPNGTSPGTGINTGIGTRQPIDVPGVPPALMDASHSRCVRGRDAAAAAICIVPVDGPYGPMTPSDLNESQASIVVAPPDSGVDGSGGSSGRGVGRGGGGGGGGVRGGVACLLQRLGLASYGCGTSRGGGDGDPLFPAETAGVACIHRRAERTIPW